MRVLLSVVGTRGDVQPVMALAIEVRARGHEVRLCVPPNFIAWSKDLGFDASAVGIEMRAPRPNEPVAPIPDLITDQFDSVARAAVGCDVIIGANAHQYAARSIAELRGVRYVNALYAPTSLPNEESARAWNTRCRERVNGNRARLGLPPIDDVLRHVVTDHPWLATDPTLDPLASIQGMEVTQTGAWILEDASPIAADLDAFLAAGDPPVYLGFGSMPLPEGTSRMLVAATRAAGRRAIVSRGWGDLQPIDDPPDCIGIGDVNQQALFPRVAAVVHHGGAGTTFTAARAGVPQVIVPLFSDQPYWASRVSALGIGTALPIAELTTDALASALRATLGVAIADRARSTAKRIVLDGAATAARRLTDPIR